MDDGAEGSGVLDPFLRRLARSRRVTYATGIALVLLSAVVGVPPETQSGLVAGTLAVMALTYGAELRARGGRPTVPALLGSVVVVAVGGAVTFLANRLVGFVLVLGGVVLLRVAAGRRLDGDAPDGDTGGDDDG